jgi:hypothetical protein
MHSILVLFVLEEFFQTGAGEYFIDQGDSGHGGDWGFAPAVAFAQSPAKADTLEIIGETFCVLFDPHSFILLDDRSRRTKMKESTNAGQ